MARFLDRVGGLAMGTKLYGDVELTPDEFEALKAFPAGERAEALAKIRTAAAEAPAA